MEIIFKIVFFIAVLIFCLIVVGLFLFLVKILFLFTPEINIMGITLSPQY